MEGVDHSRDDFFVDLIKVGGLIVVRGHVFQNLAGRLKQIDCVGGIHDLADHGFRQRDLSGILFDSGVNRQSPAALPVAERLTCDRDLPDRVDAKIGPVVCFLSHLTGLPWATDAKDTGISAGEFV